MESVGDRNYETGLDQDEFILGTIQYMAVGTVAYMSPEQAKAMELDGRTDPFSFGLVLYEMCTAHPAFTGNSNAVIFEAILNRNPVSPVRLNPQVPGVLEEIITKAIEKDSDLRYQTAAEIRTDLKRLKRDLDSGKSSAVVAPHISFSDAAASATVALPLCPKCRSQMKIVSVIKDSVIDRILAHLQYKFEPLPLPAVRPPPDTALSRISSQLIDPFFCFRNGGSTLFLSRKRARSLF